MYTRSSCIRCSFRAICSSVVGIQGGGRGRKTRSRHWRITSYMESQHSSTSGPFSTLDVRFTVGPVVFLPRCHSTVEVTRVANVESTSSSRLSQSVGMVRLLAEAQSELPSILSLELGRSRI